ncbi:MAG: CvpA family protein [Chloroflexota bacterium]|nr:CvpA family protein [Chloroflexota bacterium]
MAALALTVLLAILWIALVGVGYWHGGWRQVVLLAAMLLSYGVLSEWAAPNGRDLSIRFHWSVARTTTGVALLYLLVGTLILGLLGSFALYRPRPLGLVERRLGAVMGVLNGGLLLALVLRTLRSYAFAAGRGQSLHDSSLSRFLIEDVGYLLLVALLLGAVAAVVGVVAARRDGVREIALLDAVTMPTAEQHDERPATPAPSVPAPPAPPIAPPTPAPVYATAPLIDWPTSPPPGVRATPPTAASLPVPEPPHIVAQPEAARPPASLPTQLRVPPRVSPPMVYPVADLIAAQAKPATRLPRPVGPPPGAAHPAFVPPVVRELDPPIDETLPPLVRELEVATGDVPVVRDEIAPIPETARNEPQPEEKEEMMSSKTQKPATDPPVPDVTLATAAMPAIVPPRPPPMPATHPASGKPPTPPSATPPAPEQRALMDEATKARTGFARVAVARQAGGRPDEIIPPHPQPAAPPEPLQPPLPTGPRVHQCPTCGYPVRNHARYCPNCGSRQGR